MNHRCMATAHPPNDSAERSTPTRSSAATTRTPPAYAVVGPRMAPNRCRTQSIHGPPPPSPYRVHDVALAYPPTRKNTGTTWNTRVSHCVHGMTSKGYSLPNWPSRKVTDEISQCPATTTTRPRPGRGRPTARAPMVCRRCALPGYPEKSSITGHYQASRQFWLPAAESSLWPIRGVPMRFAKANEKKARVRVVRTWCGQRPRPLRSRPV